MASKARLDKYGLTQEEFAALREKQEDLCTICGAEFGDWLEDKAHIDHDYKTGEVRGLLCVRCNVGLGHFADAPYLLQAAKDYLATPPARAVLREMRPFEPVFTSPLESTTYQIKPKRVFSKTYRPNRARESFLSHLLTDGPYEQLSNDPGEFSHRRDNYLSL